MATYLIDSDNPDDKCCGETPLQGSYYCSLHAQEDHIHCEYDGFKFLIFFNSNFFYFTFCFSKEDFLDIVGTDKNDGELSFKFQYDVEPFIRLVLEKDVPKHLLSEYYKRENLNDPKEIGSIDKCHITKEVQCFNKSKTKGVFFKSKFELNRNLNCFCSCFTGILTLTHGCGINLSFSEMISAESRNSVIDLLKKTIDITKTSYKYCIYDNGCHLDESVKAHIDSHKSLKDMKFYIDRFHLKNHKRKV